MDLEELKQFLKVTDNGLDTVLTGYQKAAEVYLTNAGVVKDYNNALYKIVVTVFCGTLLRNPELLNDQGGIDGAGGITFNAIVAQLRSIQAVTMP